MRIVKIGAIWCPGCLVMKKIWKNILHDYPDLDIQEYDYDIDNEEIIKYNPGKVLPVVIFLNGEEELVRLTGEQKESVLREYIDKYR